jgi:acyl-coenzyme A synthetase/AMP-(fatty) acid ligase
MFLDLDKKKSSSIAAVDSTGMQISYGELNGFANEFYSAINKRTLIFILSENTIGSLAGYVASLSVKVVPLLLSSKTDKEVLDKLINLYRPEYLWLPERLSGDFNYDFSFRKFDYVLLKTGMEAFQLNDNLSLLLTTSGSTGSPKLVRHSYSNVEENARNVAAFFELSPVERAIAILPMQYTMGLSVITSHLFAGSAVLLVNGTLTDKSFWSFLKEHRATSFTGVPYSFEVLSKLRFTGMDLPDLKLLTQGGGKLSNKLFLEFAEYAHRTGRKFIATYGQTEGTARMAFLPADMALAKPGSIGKAIPNGELSLINENGEEIVETEASGEMVYRGPNVTLGYALTGEDLIKGDENNGVLFTGDIAKRDAEGYYYIIGRLSRFLKLYGFRISLDETEQIVKSVFDIDCICTGNDEMMKIYITDRNKKDQIHNYVVDKTGLFHKAIEIEIIDEIPKNASGKTIYSNLSLQ